MGRWRSFHLLFPCVACGTQTMKRGTCTAKTCGNETEGAGNWFWKLISIMSVFARECSVVADDIVSSRLFYLRVKALSGFCASVAKYSVLWFS